MPNVFESDEIKFQGEGSGKQYKTDVNFASEYIEMLENLDLEVGGNKVAGKNCALHKSNCAVRKSIRDSSFVSELFKEISNFVGKTKKTNRLAELHGDNKCKLTVRNHTRFTSSFMMLYTVVKANNKRIFNDNHKPPIEISLIEKYSQILLPVFIFMNEIQANHTNISHVVPSVLFLVYGALDRMVLDDKDQLTFRDSLIENHLSKFNYELSSKEYLVAAVLNVEIAEEYKDRSFSKKYYEAGIQSIYEVLTMYEKEVNSDKDKASSKVEKLSTQLGTDTAQVHILKNFYKLTKKRSENISHRNEIKDEVNLFIKTISHSAFNSTETFWLEHKKSLPNLFRLALRLFSIPATTADIERFFSITGNTNSKTRANMSDELLEMLALLKVQRSTLFCSFLFFFVLFCSFLLC